MRSFVAVGSLAIGEARVAVTTHVDRRHAASAERIVA
jgi:hypothetical protein